MADEKKTSIGLSAPAASPPATASPRPAALQPHTAPSRLSLHPVRNGKEEPLRKLSRPRHCTLLGL